MCRKPHCMNMSLTSDQSSCQQLPQHSSGHHQHQPQPLPSAAMFLSSWMTFQRRRERERRAAARIERKLAVCFSFCCIVLIRPKNCKREPAEGLNRAFSLMKVLCLNACLAQCFNRCEGARSAFNKEKVLLGDFSGHCHIIP